MCGFDRCEWRWRNWWQWLHAARAARGARGDRAECACRSGFVGRRPTGEIWSPALAAQHPQRDWILSRILWLSGTEHGRNRLGCVDTFRRYIYLHGTPYEDQLGIPASHGCVRLANDDAIALAAMVAAGTEVLIHQ